MPVGSQLAIRIGYNSNVLSAGRTLGIENFGLAPGISFYHISVLFADVTSYWSKWPNYYKAWLTYFYLSLTFINLNTLVKSLFPEILSGAHLRERTVDSRTTKSERQ